jgi:hypothetical protein
MARNGTLGPDHHLSRLMTPELDPTAGAKPEKLRRLWPAAIVGTLLLALFNAQGLEKWVNRLPDSPVTNALITAGQEWNERMERLGPARLFDAVRKAFQDFRGQ